MKDEARYETHWSIRCCEPLRVNARNRPNCILHSSSLFFLPWSISVMVFIAVNVKWLRLTKGVALKRM